MPFHVRSFFTGCLLSAIGVVTACLAADEMPEPHDHHAAAGRLAPSLLPVSTAHTFPELMANADEVMHHAMASATRNGDADHDFASAMIPHHQGAVDMAKVELLYGHDPVLRRMAQEIIVSQLQEIAVMQRRVDAMPGTPTTPPITSAKAP